MFITVLNDDVILLILEPVTLIEDEYWLVVVNLTKPFTFLINEGNEPVPFSTTSNTTSNAEFAFVKYVAAIDAVVIYCTLSVLLIEDEALVNIDGIEPVPFAIISNTISNPVPTLLISVVIGVIDDVLWVYTNSFAITLFESDLAYPIPSNVCTNWEPVAADGYR